MSFLMGLENLINKGGIFGRNFLFSSILVASLFFSCSEEKIVYKDRELEDPQNRIPGTPSLIRAIPGSIEPQRTIQLLINDNSDNETGFILERKKEENSFQYLYSFGPQQGAGEIFVYNDSDLEKLTRYTYRIKAYNDLGSSDWSTISATSSGIQIGTIEVKTSADSYVDKSYPDINFGNERNLALSKNYGIPENNEERIFLFFSLLQLPNYSERFSSATLRLADASGGNTIYPGSMSIHVGEALNFWNENSICWSNQPVIFYPGGQISNYDPRGERYVLIDVSRTVSRWYSNVSPNRGFGIMTPSEDRFASFYSREGYNPGSANLSICYEW